MHAPNNNLMQFARRARARIGLDNDTRVYSRRKIPTATDEHTHAHQKKKKNIASGV